MTGIADSLDNQGTFIPFMVGLFTSDGDFKQGISFCLNLVCQLFPLYVLDSYLANFYLWYRLYIYIHRYKNIYGTYFLQDLH